MLQGDLDHRHDPTGARAVERPGDIMKALDAGAYGIICPMINNRAEAQPYVGPMAIRRWANAAPVPSAPRSMAAATTA